MNGGTFQLTGGFWTTGSAGNGGPVCAGNGKVLSSKVWVRSMTLTRPAARTTRIGQLTAPVCFSKSRIQYGQSGPNAQITALDRVETAKPNWPVFRSPTNRTIIESKRLTLTHAAR